MMDDSLGTASDEVVSDVLPSTASTGAVAVHDVAASRLDTGGCVIRPGDAESEEVDLERLLDESNLDSDGFIRLRDFDREGTVRTSPAPAELAFPLTDRALSTMLDRWRWEAQMRLKPAQIRLPWEIGVLDRRNPLQVRLDALFVRTRMIEQPHTASDEGVAKAHNIRQSYTQQAVFPAAVKRIKDLNMTDREDGLRLLALKQWLLIVQIAPETSGLGRTMLREVAQLKTDVAVLQLMDDFFARKAVSTLQKRSACVLRFVKWCQSNLLPAFPLTESIAYRYCRYLVEEGAGSPSSISSFRQAVGFLKYAADFDGCSEVISSSRIAGVAHKHMVTKKPLKQRPPFTARQIWLLEVACLKSESIYDRIFAGHVLFCIFSRSRWGDHLYIEQLILDELPDGSGFLQGNTKRAKTSITSAQRTRFLPLTAVLRHLGPRCWWTSWLKDRVDAGLIVGPNTPFLPAPKLHGGWCERELSTAEAGAWVRELLRALGNSAEDAGMHSCKVTLLSWMAKAGASEPVRLMLGYHVGSSSDTLLHYSRDALSGPLRELNQVISNVISGKFRPDTSRSGYFPDKDAHESVAKSIRFPTTPCVVNPKGFLNPVPKAMYQPPDDRDHDVDGLFEETAVEEDEGGGSVGGLVKGGDGTGDGDNAGDKAGGVDKGEGDNEGAFEGSANGDSEESSSSESETDNLVEVVAANLNKSSSSGPSKSAAFDSSDILYVHERLGTLHKGKGSSSGFLACGRVLHAAHRKVDDPNFGWSKCKGCFGNTNTPK
jgi:hypothetical protein